MRAGDHFRCDEGDLVVAGIRSDGAIANAGWPLGFWRASDVSQVYACTDAEHVDMIDRCRAMQDNSDPRKRIAHDHNCDVCAAARAANPP